MINFIIGKMSIPTIQYSSKIIIYRTSVQATRGLIVDVPINIYLWKPNKTNGLKKAAI